MSYETATNDIPHYLRLPFDPSKMSRKERRKWYKQNRKRLGLPRWNELNKLKDNKK